VKVTNNGKSYSFGFSLFKRRDQKPASGTLQELLNAGQSNLWGTNKDGGASAIEGDVRVSAEGNNVVITIDDTKLRAQLFSSRPPVVEFESALPGEEKVSTRTVAVTYEDAPESGGEIVTSNPRLLKTIENSDRINGGYIRALGYSPDGSSLIAANHNLTAFDPATGKSRFQEELKSFVESPLSFSKDGKVVAFAYHGSVVVFDLANRKRIKEIPIETASGFTHSVALSPDASVVVYDGDDALLFHDLKTGKTAKRDKGARAGEWGLRFSPDASYLVSSGSVLDIKTFGVFVEKLDIGSSGLTDISNDSKRFAVGTFKDAKSGFKVFSLPGLELIHEETNLPAGAASMALSPSGKYLALGYMGGTIQIWDLAQKKVAASWVAHEGTGLVYWPVAFAPDGKSLATGNKSTIKIWDLTP
jgi:WD40 repeat protein